MHCDGTKELGLHPRGTTVHSHQLSPEIRTLNWRRAHDASHATLANQGNQGSLTFLKRVAVAICGLSGFLKKQKFGNQTVPRWPDCLPVGVQAQFCLVNLPPKFNSPNIIAAEFLNS